MIDPRDIAEARAVLGAQLAAYRVAAGRIQKALAKEINYHRSSVANVETGRQNVPRQFWVTCDGALGAGGALIDAYDELEGMVRRHRAEAAGAARGGRPRPQGMIDSGHLRPVDGEELIPDLSACMPGRELLQACRTDVHPDPAAVGEQVQSALDAAFHDLTHTRLLAHLDDTETAILALCKQAILTSFRHDASVGMAHLLRDLVRINDRVLVIKIRPDLHFDHLLRVVLQDPKSMYLEAASDYIHAEIEFNDSVGRYQRVRITLPTHLTPVHRSRIIHQIADAFEAGNRWLRARVGRALNNLAGSFEHEALRLLRHELAARGCAGLARQLWLVKVVDGRVTYAVDDEVAVRVLNAGRHFHALQQAPASIASALLANSIPLDRSFSRQAIGSGRTICMSLNDTPYELVNADFLLAQGAIYDDQMLLTPLAGDRRGWLLAAYPAAVRAHLAGVLDGSRTGLKRHFSTTSERMRSAAAIARSQDGGITDYVDQ